MSVLITLTDVEPAVRLNALLEQGGVETTVVSPLDDMRSAIRRGKPDVVVFTGGLLDPQHVQVARELQWDDVAVVGFADVRDPLIDERLRALGYVEVFGKPVQVDEAAAGVLRGKGFDGPIRRLPLGVDLEGFSPAPPGADGRPFRV
ncbi:MAG: hypothetical protein ACLGIK_13795, partial [Gemmatimonadota bacterium]